MDDRLARFSERYRFAVAEAAAEKVALKTIQGKVKSHIDAQEIAQAVAKTVQEMAHAQVASVASRCLEAVFGESAYEFKIDFIRKRGKTEAVLKFCRGGLELDDPLEEVGGGVIDVAAFALRLACLMLARPRKRRLLILDEPFKMLSKEYHEAVKGLLETLAEEMGIQFLLTTHSEGLACGKVIQL